MASATNSPNVIISSASNGCANSFEGHVLPRTERAPKQLRSPATARVQTNHHLKISFWPLFCPLCRRCLQILPRYLHRHEVNSFVVNRSTGLLTIYISIFVFIYTIPFLAFSSLSHEYKSAGSAYPSRACLAYTIRIDSDHSTLNHHALPRAHPRSPQRPQRLQKPSDNMQRHHIRRPPLQTHPSALAVQAGEHSRCCRGDGIWGGECAGRGVLLAA